MRDTLAGAEWIVVIVRLPSEPSRHRVAVWRELRRAGAVQLGPGSWALPSSPPFAEPVDRVAELIQRGGGDMLRLRTAADDIASRDRMQALYNDARLAEWDEFRSECGKCVAELEREIAKEKFTLAELDEEEQNVDRIRRWHRELRQRDLYGAVDPETTQAQLDACVTVLDRFTSLVYEVIGLQ